MVVAAIIGVLLTFIASINGLKVIFRPNPTGWTCGDSPLLSVRISYSTENENSLSSLLVKIAAQCQEKCLNTQWCHSYSLDDTPMALPNQPAQINDDFNELPNNYYYFQPTTAKCNLYNQPRCTIVKWPGSDHNVLFYKIAEIDSYDLVEKKCQRPFETYMPGPPDVCAQVCDYSPLCIGFNYKFADNLCFMVNADNNNNNNNNNYFAPPGRRRTAQLSSCPSQLLKPDMFMVFYDKKEARVVQSQLNDPLPQPYPGFFAHNGNCRGGVTANYTVMTGNNGVPAALAVYACPTCNTTVESCLKTCRNFNWCLGVSVFAGSKIDYSVPMCFLKSAKCDPSKIELNAVYRFFEKLDYWK